MMRGRVITCGRSLSLLSALLVALFVAGAAGCGGRSEHGATAPATPSVAVDGGDSHACALLSAGEIYCWGDNLSGKLGSRLPRGQNHGDKPLKVGRIPKAVSLAAGFKFTCAALSDGNVDC